MLPNSTNQDIGPPKNTSSTLCFLISFQISSPLNITKNSGKYLPSCRLLSKLEIPVNADPTIKKINANTNPSRKSFNYKGADIKTIVLNLKKWKKSSENYQFITRSKLIIKNPPWFWSPASKSWNKTSITKCTRIQLLQWQIFKYLKKI